MTKRSQSPALWVLLLAAAAAATASGVASLADEAEAGGDSLQSALEAVNRRQRDLTALGGGAAGTPLAEYRFRPDADADLAFLAPPGDFAGDGQPENIGYGYQKSSAAGGGEAGGRAVERLLLEYLEANGGLPPAPMLLPDKRGSVFRERSPLRSPLLLRKRKPLLRASPFRERARAAGPLDLAALEALEAQKRERGAAEEMLRQAEAEAEAEHEAEEREREEAETEAAEETEAEEERRRRQEAADEDEERQEEYLQLLQTLWRKYQATNADGRRVEDLPPDELQELLAGAADSGDMDKRQYGGFDYFNNAGALGGWQSGGMYRKRGGGVGRQRLENGGGAGAGFLYALKFASPAAQREALEALTDDDAAEMGDERDEDAVRAAAAAIANPAGAGGRRLTPIEWERAAEAEAAAEAAAEDAFGPAPASPEDYQRLLAAAEEANVGGAVRKRGRAGQRKRFLYDGALLAAQRKRYPVTKRSSDFYANPPLMHRRSSPSAEHATDERRRKKDASNAATDPKVANELNQIFGGEGRADEHAHHVTTASPEPSSPAGGAAPPSASPTPHDHSDHPGDSHNGSRELTPEEQRQRNEGQHGGGGDGHSVRGATQDGGATTEERGS